MGTRRSRHNKGRKPVYKEHRENLCPPSSTCSFQTESAALVPVRLNMLGEKLNGSGLAELPDNFRLRRSSENPSGGPLGGRASVGAAPKSKSFGNDTLLKIPSLASQSISIVANFRCVSERANLVSATELTTQQPSSNTAGDGPSANVGSSTSCMMRETAPAPSPRRKPSWLST
jgi:hypothetical protein